MDIGVDPAAFVVYKNLPKFFEYRSIQYTKSDLSTSREILIENLNQYGYVRITVKDANARVISLAILAEKGKQATRNQDLRTLLSALSRDANEVMLIVGDDFSLKKKNLIKKKKRRLLLQKVLQRRLILKKVTVLAHNQKLTLE